MVKMRKAYLIIETGFEGIEELCYLTDIPAKAVKRLRKIHQKIDDESERDPESWREQNNFIANLHRIQDKKDFYCIQRWNGQTFECACNELGIETSKLMLR